MDEKNWQNVKEIFLEALEKNAESRVEFLDEVCANDAELREEIESLLASHEEIEDFIEDPAFQVDEVFTHSANQTEKRLGNYKIIKEIGAGGMGIVYLAVREDEQFRRRVAIKLVKRGLDTEDVLRRFRNERQILASLHHPHIAGLLDGGTSNDGLPYFVMEYIEGSPLLQYCEEHQFSINERLELFKTICSAVQHAHQNLVIHRDLKPSNILITHNGELKLLDFGVAKVLNPELMGDNLVQTQTQFRVMTPEYASPEQFRGGHITTATDVYSLGVILYELLTGDRPYKLKDTTPEEMMHLICNSEPAPPSVISNSKKDQKSKIQNPKLKGDLDNIILTALRKEPSRRYKSVEAFADDIERHLKGLPVAARPNTFKYRTSKFIKRNKAGVIAASLVLFAVLGGLTATVWQARIALQEKEKAEIINGFLKQTLKYSNPFLNNLRKSGNETTVNEALDEATRRLENGELDSQPEIKAELEQTIAMIYFSQGNSAKARQLLEKYVIFIRGAYNENHPKMINAMCLWAILVFNKGTLDESEKIYRHYLPLLRNEYQKGNVKADFLGEALNNFAYLRRTQGDSREAEMLFRETLELMPRMSGEGRNLIATTRSTLASVLADQGKFDEAVETARLAVEEYHQRNETDSPSYGFSLNILGGFLTEKGEFAEAEEDLKQSEAIFRKYVSPASLWCGDNFRNQAILLYFQGKYDEAVSKAGDAQKNYEEGFGKNYDHYPTVLIFKGLSLAKSGHPDEGEKLLREAVKIRTELLPKEHFWGAIANSALGECLMIQKRFAEAKLLISDSYENLKNSQGADNPRTNLAEKRLDKLNEVWKKSEK